MNPADHSWFYAENDEQKGPVPFEEIRGRVARGELPSHTLIWCQGQADWKPFRDIAAEFAPSPVASGIPGAVTLPQGHAEPDGAPLPIPSTLKRVSFAKLMIVTGIAIVLLVTTVVLVAISASAALSGSSATSNGLMALTGLLGLATLGVLVWSVVLAMICVYRAWLMIQSFGASCTPGLAVGLLFVPIFNIYWAFRAYHGWSRDYNNAIRSDPRLQSAPIASEGAFLTYCICNAAAFPFSLLSNIDGLELLGLVDSLLTLASLGFLIYMFVQICGAVNFFVDARDRDLAARS